MKNIKTFEQACKILKKNPKHLPIVKHLDKKHQKSIIAFYKLTTIIEAINDGWKPNWNDSSQWKWYNWFWIKASDKKPSGLGFSCSLALYTTTLTGVGSRLCFKTETDAKYVREKFKKLYIDYLLYT